MPMSDCMGEMGGSMMLLMMGAGGLVFLLIVGVLILGLVASLKFVRSSA